MSDIAEAIQQLSKEQREFFQKKLKEGMSEFMKKFEEQIKKEDECPYVILEGKKVQKNLRQFIPYTEEEWNEIMEKSKKYKYLKNDKYNEKRIEEGNRYLQKHLFDFLEERTTSV